MGPMLDISAAAASPIVLGAFGFREILPAVLMAGGVVLLLWARRPSPGGVVPRAADVSGAGRQAAERVETVVRDAEELAQLMAGQMDRQAQRLEQLIEEADARIRKLERLAEEASRPRPAARGEKTDPLSAQIFDLADQGMPPVEIARSLDQQTGKVELILALRQR